MSKKNDRQEQGLLRRNFTTRPETFNDKERSVEIIVSTEAPYKRYIYREDVRRFELVQEVLEHTNDAINLSRLNSGAAPVLDSHNSWNLKSQMGVIESTRMENKELVSKIRFSSREELSPIIKDIKEGIIKNVSVGYTVEEYQIEEKKGELPVAIAKKWTPLEASFVSVPADPNAGARNFEQENLKNRMDNLENKQTNKQTNEGSKKMSDVLEKQDDAQKQSAPESVKAAGISPDELAKEKAEAVKAETRRVTEINKLCKLHQMDDSFSEKLIAEGVSYSKACDLILARIAENSTAQKINNEPQQQEPKSPTNLKALRKESKKEVEEKVVAAIEARLCHRNNSFAGIAAKESDAKTRAGDYKDASYLDLGLEYLRATEGKSVSRVASPLARAQFLTREMASSDFPLVLADTMNKTVLGGYETAQSAWRSFTRIDTVRDFREKSLNEISNGSELVEVGVDGDLEEGVFQESGEKAKVVRYGRRFVISESMWTDDDMGVFERAPQNILNQVTNLEHKVIYGVLSANANLADGNPLFHSSHKNLGTSGSALSVDALSAGRQAMREQTDLDGQAINVLPQYLIVPAELETTAERLLTMITPNQSSQVSPFAPGGRTPLQLIVEPRLTDPAAWYLAAPQGMAPGLVFLQMAGMLAPMVSQRMNERTRALELDARYYINAKAEGFRGLYKATGAA